jgi:hypothetical protein
MSQKQTTSGQLSRGVVSRCFYTRPVSRRTGAAIVYVKVTLSLWLVSCVWGSGGIASPFSTPVVLSPGKRPPVIHCISGWGTLQPIWTLWRWEQSCIAQQYKYLSKYRHPYKFLGLFNFRSFLPTLMLFALFLFVYDLFNDALNSSDYIAPNGRMPSEY